MKPSRAQVEIGLLVGGVVLLLLLYRSYLERSLVIQEQLGADMTAKVDELLAEHLAQPNGRVPVDHLSVDGDGKTHAPRFRSVPEPESPEPPEAA